MAAGDGESWWDAKPVRTQNQNRSNNIAPASLGAIDQQILDLQEQLGEKTQEQYEANRRTTRAKAMWLRHRDKQVLLSRSRNEKTSEDVRDVIARSEYDDDGTIGLKLWERMEASEGFEKTLNSEVKAIQARLSALQSVGNHVFRAT